MPFHRAHLYWKFLYNLYTLYIFVKNEWYKMATTIAVDYNRKGSLLEELAGLKEPAERKTRLFDVIADIRSIVARNYTNMPGAYGVEKLEDQLDNHESFDREELGIISLGVKDELGRGLDQHPLYNRDSINQVFIALYWDLIGELRKSTLDGIVDYSMVDNTNRELSKVIRQLRIYDVLSTWVTDNKRHIVGLAQNEVEQATRQFEDLKKSARGFVRGFRRLLRRSYNIDASYNLFAKKNWETYEDVVSVVEATIKDCKRIIKANNSKVEGNGIALMRRFAEVISLNAEYYFLQMGYEMLNDDAARHTIPDIERFQNDLIRDAFNPLKIRYLSVMPNYGVIIFPEVKRLAPEVREFYEALKPR